VFHDPFQPLVDDVIKQLVPTVEQHYRSVMRRFVFAAAFVELRDGAIHGGPIPTLCVDGFIRQSEQIIHPRLHDQTFLI